MKQSTTAKPKPKLVRKLGVDEKDRRTVVAARIEKMAKAKAKPKPDTRKDRAMKLYARILAGPTFERAEVEKAGTDAMGFMDIKPAELDAIMNYLFDVYSKWMEDTLDEYVEFVPELRDTELCERRRAAKRKRNLRG